VFKRLWTDVRESFRRTFVEDKIREHRTEVWPSKTELRQAVQSRYSIRSQHHTVRAQRVERQSRGDNPESIPWVEHVLSETPAESGSRVSARRTQEIQGHARKPATTFAGDEQVSRKQAVP
jgi:hypothetical protein